MNTTTAANNFSSEEELEGYLMDIQDKQYETWAGEHSGFLVNEDFRAWKESQEDETLTLEDYFDWLDRYF